MTGPENERLAKVETLVGVIGSDVAEVKTDVKELRMEFSNLRRVFDRRSGFGDAFTKAVPWLALVVSVVAVVAR